MQDPDHVYAVGVDGWVGKQSADIRLMGCKRPERPRQVTVLGLSCVDVSWHQSFLDDADIRVDFRDSFPENLDHAM